LHVTGNSDWELLVDDYEGRPHYTIIEQYANLEKMVGRMAVFTPKKDVDLDALQRSLDAYASDWR
jgi:hypothetical protein